MLIDTSAIAMDGGPTVISTDVVETVDTYSQTSHVTVFRRFRTGDGNEWCQVSGDMGKTVDIPDGCSPSRRTVINILTTGVEGSVALTIAVAAKATTLEYNDPSVLIGENVWRVN